MKQAAITERDPRAKAAIRRWDELKTERANHEQDWESIAELIRPQRGAFSSDDHTTRHAKKPLSSRPIMAGSTFASELFSSVTNPANRWFSMSTPDDQLNEWKPMKLWLQNSTQIVNASFGPNVSAFYPAALQLYADVACFGNSCQYDQIDNFEQRIVDVTLSLAEVVFGIDAHGFVNEAVRRYSLTPVQAARLFKGKGELPARVTDAAEKGSTDKHVYYQHVTRNDDYTPGRIGKSGKRWLSRTACEVAETLVRESGYDEMPFYCPRWDVESGETYGTGPGFIALASSRAVHEMDAATLRAAQNAADPTKLAPDRAAWPIHGRVRPGEVIFGGVNMQGNPMIRNLDQHANIGLTIEEKREKIEEIKDAFHWTLLSLAGRTGLNELEVMEIQAQRQRLWAPNLGRLQHEYLARKIERRFAMLWRAGQIPPPPEGTDGVPLMAKYESAAAAAQKSAEAAAMSRIVNDIAPLIGVKPRLADRIDEDGYIEALAAARGAPAEFLRSRDEADELAAQRAQQQQAAQAMQMAGAGAAAMKDGAEAMATMQGASEQ